MQKNSKKCALVTGGSRGIGRAICMSLAKELNCHVLINYVSNDEAAQKTLQEIEETGGSGELLKFSIANHAETLAALNDWKKKNPDLFIEILVNNAGILKDGLMIMMSENDWDSVVDTSLKGFFNVTKNVLHEMIRARKGRIINIVSLSGLKGMPGQVNYSASKGGVIAATKSLAQEIAKRKITVNAVAPGFIETEMTQHLNKELVKFVPAARFGKPEEVADLVVFLASEKAAYITGEVININGGLYS